MSDPQDRNVAEGTQYQGVDERISYTLDVIAIGAGPSAPAVDVFREPDLSNSVKAEVMPVGSPAVAGNVITLPPLQNLAEGGRYRVEVQFTLAGNLLEHWFVVEGQR